MSEVTLTGVLPEGYTIHRKRKDEFDLAQIREAIERKQILQVTVTAVHDGEIQVLLGTTPLGKPLIGVMPPSEFDEKIYKGYEGFVGELCDVIITGWDDRREVALVSRRQARQMKREALLKSGIGVGSVVQAVVRSIKSYGAFVDIGGMHAILPINEISHSFISHPGEVLTRGEVIEVKIIAFDPTIPRARVSMKALTDPWKSVEEHYSKNTIVLGEISGIRDQQVWVRPEPYIGVEILCPALPNRKYELGQKVRVKITTVSGSEKKLRGKIIGRIR